MSTGSYRDAEDPGYEEGDEDTETGEIPEDREYTNDATDHDIEEESINDYLRRWDEYSTEERKERWKELDSGLKEYVLLVRYPEMDEGWRDWTYEPEEWNEKPEQEKKHLWKDLYPDEREYLAKHDAYETEGLPFKDRAPDDAVESSPVVETAKNIGQELADQMQQYGLMTGDARFIIGGNLLYTVSTTGRDGVDRMEDIVREEVSDEVSGAVDEARNDVATAEEQAAGVVHSAREYESNYVDHIAAAARHRDEDAELSG